MNLIFKNIKQIKHPSVCYSGPVLELSDDGQWTASKPILCFDVVKSGWFNSTARHSFPEMEHQIIMATECLEDLRIGRIKFSDPTSQTLNFVFEIEIQIIIATKYLDDLKIGIIIDFDSISCIDQSKQSFLFHFNAGKGWT